MTQLTDEQRQGPEIRVEEESDTYVRLVAEPLDPGFGITLGNALRRVLISSLPGAAVTAVQIEGVLHEFSTIPHIKEDVIEFLLNVKQIRLRSLADRPARLLLDISDRVGPVTAADIQAPPEYEIINPELYLATLDSAQGQLRVEFTVETGRGYVPAGHSDGLPIGTIPMDAIFTPVMKANYRVERAHSGQDANLERLVLEVWTDGTTSGVEAISHSGEMLADLFSLFVHMGRPALKLTARGLAAGMAISSELYNMPVEDLNLSVRAYNCLKRSGIMTVGNILEKSEEELLALRNFGRKSYEEMKARLLELGILKTEQAPAAAEEEEAAPTAVQEPPSVLEEAAPPAEAAAPTPKSKAAVAQKAATEAEAPEEAPAEEAPEEAAKEEEIDPRFRALLGLRRELSEE